MEITNTGVVMPKHCTSITGEVQAAAIANNSPQRLFRVSAACEATLRGDIVFGNDWTLQIGNVGYSVNGVQLSVSAGKDTMLGFATFASGGNTVGVASVMAIKRVP